MSGARTGREAFMRQISRGLGREAPSAPAEVPRTSDDLLRRVDVNASARDMTDRFIQTAHAAGMSAERLGRGQLPDFLEEYIGQHVTQRAMLAIEDSELARLVEGVLADRIVPRDAPFDAAFDADLGVTDVVAAIAETGSLVLAPGPQRGRAPFLVPGRHLAFVREEIIVPDLIDWLRAEEVASSARPAATIVVTGPSKTADIEGILVTGVHGPGAVDVVVIDREGRP